MWDNSLIKTDSYKVSHWKQYPPGTEKVYSYFESRGGEFNEVVFFGLQYLLKRHFEGIRVSLQEVEEAAEFWDAHFGTHGLFNFDGWIHILRDHNGRLPIRIKAVPEGTVVPTGNVLMTVENTCPKCFWLTNFIETLLVQAWYPCTIATNSREIKKIILKYLEETGDPLGLPFKLHDFGYRGVSSQETAAIGGMAHLVNFRGTDTAAGIVAAQQAYNAGMIGFSIPAAEHSTITSWGKENEVEAFRNMLDSYPTGLVACVSDSYNIYRACEDYWGIELKDKVLSREGTTVIRPDSGNPPEVVVSILNILWNKFGGLVNDKGYKVLDPHVRIIQGDGIDRKMVETILMAMKQRGYSTDNIAFGSGGGLLQKFDRDTCRFAFKCSHITINGEEKEVWKDPVTAKDKMSKRGKLSLIPDPLDIGSYKTVEGTSQAPDNILETIFENGKLVVEHSFEDIRQRAEIRG